MLSALRQARLLGEVRAAYDQFLATLDTDAVRDHALRAGDTMPAFLLPSAEGKLVESAELLRAGAVIVTFFRGDWCPFCSATLDALEAFLPQMAAAGGRLVAVMPETGGRALATKRQHRLHYDVLTDVDLTLAMAFGIVFRAPPLYRALLRRRGIDLAERSGNATWFLPVPATFLVRPDGVIARAWVNIDFTQRAEPAEILDALRSL
jgi:peroxiredoxin